MWVFTRYGFFSAVCARQGNRTGSEAIDPARLMVRARVRGHLEALKARFADLLGTCDIHESATTDYAFRIVVDKLVWARVVSTLAEEIDYGNFKSEVARHQGRGGVDYEHSLHEVWSIMYGLQSHR
jgi:hypothetical protein